MRSTALFITYLTCALLLGALLAAPVYVEFDHLFDEPMYRYVVRGGMFIALIALVPFLRYLDLNNKRALGYAVAPSRFIADLLIGLLLGVIIMLPLITALVTLGVRVVSPDAALTWSELVLTSLQALIAGLLIAFIEETFFRGAMFTAVERETGLWLAAILTSLLYAALHFMRTGYAVPSDHLEWYSGVLVLGHLFEQYADPASIVDSFLALFAVGMLLALVRAKTGHIAWCIGLHAGWVITIKLTKDITDVDPSVQFSFLVGTYDGVVGYLALILIAVTAAGYYALAMRRSG